VWTGKTVDQTPGAFSKLWIDVRSEGEFAQGHIPGAINLPLLNNEERAAVGTAYKQVSTVEAVQLGLSFFAAKAEAYLSKLEEALHGNPQVNLYCWRGGMRSQMVAKWLRSAGYQGQWIIGGYKAYRKRVLAAWEQLALHELVVVHGRTGVGKSQWLGELEQAGFPVVNFQRMAHHRGSIFGAMGQGEPCPTQQQFDNEVAEVYLSIAKAPKILVEIEGAIGPIHLPKPLCKRIQQAPMILLERSMEDRVRHLQIEYVPDQLPFDETVCLANLSVLYRFFTREEREMMEAAIGQRNFPLVISLLLEKRYDPAYGKSLARCESQIVARFDLSRDKAMARAFVDTLLS